MILSLISAALVMQGGAVAQEDGQAVLERSRAKLAQYTDVRMKVSGTDTIDPNNPLVMDYKAMRPSYYAGVAKTIEFYGTGKDTYIYTPKDNYYAKNIGSGDPTISLRDNIGFDVVLGLKPYYAAQGKAKTAKFEGKDAVALDIISLIERPSPYGEPLTLYLEPETLIPLGWESEVYRDGKLVNKGKTVYTNVQLGNSLKPQDFKWSPPKDAKTTQPKG